MPYIPKEALITDSRILEAAKPESSRAGSSLPVQVMGQLRSLGILGLTAQTRDVQKSKALLAGLLESTSDRKLAASAMVQYCVSGEGPVCLLIATS